MPRSLHRKALLTLLTSEAGVINATAAMIGLGTLTVAGGVAASSFSGLIPIAQDRAAQQNVAQIGTAQGLAQIMDGSFTDLEGLEAGGYMPAYRAATGPAVSMPPRGRAAPVLWSSAGPPQDSAFLSQTPSPPPSRGYPAREPAASMPDWSGRWPVSWTPPPAPSIVLLPRTSGVS